MAIAQGRSQLQQFTRSTLQQRGQSTPVTAVWLENLWILNAKESAAWADSGHPAAPPVMPGAFLTIGEIQPIAWTVIPPPPPGNFGWPFNHTPFYFDIYRSWNRLHDADPGGIGDTGVSDSSDAAVRNPLPQGLAFGGIDFLPSTDPNLRGKLSPSNFPEFYKFFPEQGRVRQNRRFASMWSYCTSASARSFSTDNFTASWVQCQRARYKWNGSGVSGFMFRGDIYARRTTGDGIGWDNAGTTFPRFPYGSGRFSVENATMYAAYGPRAADTFIEVPFDFPLDRIPTSTLSDGFVGQAIFAIDFETPAQFSARTGIVISG
jgi:hypothetical protein